MQFSYSQLQTYQQCQLRYAYQKIDNIPAPPEASLALILGSAIHDTLESLYRRVTEKQTPTKNEVLRFFETHRQDELRNLHEEHAREVFQPTDRQPFYERGVSYISRYHDTYAPFAEASGIPMGIEEQVIITLDEEISFKGKVDRLDVRDGTMTIVDYKTTKKYPKDNHDVIQDQITLYALGVQQAYGSKITALLGKIVYLHLETEYTREINPEEMQNVQEKYYQLATEILRKRKLRERGDKDAFPPTQGYRCSSCPYQEICPLFVHGYKHDEAVSFDDMQIPSLKKFIDEFAVLSAQANLLQKRKEATAKLLGKYAAEKGYGKLYWFENKLSVSTTVSIGPDKEHKQALRERLLQEGLLDDVLEIDRYKLKKLVDDGTISLEDYQELIAVSTSHSAGRPSKIKASDKQLFDEKVGE